MLRDAELNQEYVQPAPLLTALVVQGCAAALAYCGAYFYSAADMTSLWPWLAGIVAAGIGRAVGLPAWWLPINALLPPAACLLLGAGIPAPVYLAAFLVLGLANTAAWRGRVPLVLSGRAAVTALVPLLPARANFSVLDLGCGTGSLLLPLAGMRPAGHYHGIEMAPLPFAVSWCRARRMASRVTVQWGDFWNADLSRYDVVYAYLSPAAMPKLWGKARREMRPGTLLVSNSFAIPGVAPSQTISYAGQRVLYVWRM